MSEDVRNEVELTAFMGEDIQNGKEFSDIDFAAFKEIFEKYDGQKQELENGTKVFYYKDPTLGIYLPVYFITKDRNLVQFGVVKNPYTLDPQGNTFTDIHKEAGDTEAVINPVEVPRDYWTINGEIVTLKPSEAKPRLEEGTLFETQQAYQEWYEREGKIVVYFRTPEEAAEYRASLTPNVTPIVKLNGKIIKNPEVLDSFFWYGKNKDLIILLKDVEPERFFDNDADVYTDLTIIDKNYFKVVVITADGFAKYGTTTTEGRLNLRDINNTFKILVERVLFGNDVPPVDNDSEEAVEGKE